MEATLPQLEWALTRPGLDPVRLRGRRGVTGGGDEAGTERVWVGGSEPGTLTNQTDPPVGGATVEPLLTVYRIVEGAWKAVKSEALP